MNRGFRQTTLLIAGLIATGSALAKDPWTHHYYTVADGTKLHYVEMGKGTPVILIHGAGGSAVGNWFSNGIAPAIARHQSRDRHRHAGPCAERSRSSGRPSQYGCRTFSNS